MTGIIGNVSDTLAGSINVNSAFNVNTQMILGHYRFCISNSNYQTLKRHTTFKWQAVERLGVEPAMQYTGKGVETVNLDGVIYPQYQGGLSQISIMRNQAGLGQPLLLIAGNGFTFGRWCIASIDEGQSIFLADGTPRKITFKLNLKKYGNDKVSGCKGIIQNALAVKS